jgi:hypothetical protein
VVLPYTKTGVVGGIMLGLGRALGETMAVTFVIGNFNQLNSLSLFEAANSITSALANEFAEAGEGLHQAALMYLGLVLFFITFVLVAAFVIFSFFIGAVCNGMTDALSDFEKAEDEMMVWMNDYISPNKMKSSKNKNEIIDYLLKQKKIISEIKVHTNTSLALGEEWKEKLSINN